MNKETDKAVAEIANTGAMALAAIGVGKTKGEIDDVKKIITISINEALGRVWIPVSERLPEELESVLVWEGSECDMAYYYKGVWNSGEHTISNPTHWMPLPDGPRDAAIDKATNG